MPVLRAPSPGGSRIYNACTNSLVNSRCTSRICLVSPNSRAVPGHVGLFLASAPLEWARDDASAPLFLARTMRLVRVAAWLVATPRAPTRLSPLCGPRWSGWIKACPPNDFASSIFVKGGIGGIVPKGRTELVHRKLHARLPCKSLALRHLSYYHIHSCHIYLTSLRCYTHAMCTLILRQPCHLQQRPSASVCCTARWLRQ
jgi:hypothetical protein